MANNVLVIEDDRDTADNIVELLSLSGYSVSTAHDGIEGLTFARNNKIDLILCDILLPRLDGYGVLRAIRNIPQLSTTPFVFLTGKVDSQDFRMGMDLGADDYLVKPFHGNDLLRVIETRIKKNKSIVGTATQNGQKAVESTTTVENVSVKILPEHYKIKKVKQKQFVFMEGDSINFLYYVIQGKVKTFRSNGVGKEFLTEIYNTGNFFGYVALLNGAEYKESALALEDSEIAMVTRDEFFHLLKEKGEISLKFIQMISANLVMAEEKMIKLAFDSARKRVADALLYLYGKYNTNGTNNSTFPAYRENIAGISGLTPESVSRNLSYFKNEGAIVVETGHIRILNFKKLENIHD